MMNSNTLPYGYTAIPIDGQEDAVLRICVVCRDTPDPLGHQLVVLREAVDVCIYLACLADAADTVQEWLELWVQRAGNGAHFSTEASLSNQMHVKRWEAILSAPGFTGVITTGWEHGSATALYVDSKAMRTVSPSTFDGESWLLCEDDRLLAKAGLEPFSSSSFRYLRNGNRFLALGGSPATAEVREMADFWPESQQYIPLNPNAGNMAVRHYLPMDIETFADVLAGVDWDGTWHGLERIDTDGSRDALSTDMPEHLRPIFMLSRQGPKATLIEVLYLKLQLWCDAIAAVFADTRAHRAPLMNLCGESFRVSFPRDSARLPLMWNGSVQLVCPGNAVRHDMHGSSTPYFLEGQAAKPSPYRAQLSTNALRGRGQVMILDVFEEEGGLVVVGTLEVQELLGSRPGDLLELRLIGRGTVANLVGHLDATEDSFGVSAYNFRTRPQKFPDVTRDWIVQTPGSRFPKCEYQILSLVGAPIDMYSLAVLGLRIFCVDHTQNLAAAVHAFDRFANILNERYDAATSLVDRIADLYKFASFCGQALGPQRITRSELSAEAAIEVVTDAVWYAILALLVRMMPAAGQDSHCKNFADGLERGIHSVYVELLRDCEDLCEQVRSLVLSDWPSNAEIGSIIAEFTG